VRTFLAECYVSAPSPTDELSALLRLGAQAAEGHEGASVRYIRSILVPGDETCFHVFEAPSSDAVVEVGRITSLPMIRIVEALELTATER
jgi:hypothetical protein